MLDMSPKGVCALLGFICLKFSWWIWRRWKLVALSFVPKFWHKLRGRPRQWHGSVAHRDNRKRRLNGRNQRMLDAEDTLSAFKAEICIEKSHSNNSHILQWKGRSTSAVCFTSPTPHSVHLSLERHVLNLLSHTLAMISLPIPHCAQPNSTVSKWCVFFTDVLMISPSSGLNERRLTTWKRDRLCRSNTHTHVTNLAVDATLFEFLRCFQTDLHTDRVTDQWDMFAFAFDFTLTNR